MFYKQILLISCLSKQQQEQQQEKWVETERTRPCDLLTILGASHLPWLSAHTSWASTGSRCCPCSPWRSPAGSRKAWAEWRAALWRSGRCRAAGTHADGPHSPSHKPPAKRKQRRSELDVRGAEKGEEKICALHILYHLSSASNLLQLENCPLWKLITEGKTLAQRSCVGFWLFLHLLNPVSRLLCVRTRENSVVITKKNPKSGTISVGRQQQAYARRIQANGRGIQRPVRLQVRTFVKNSWSVETDRFDCKVCWNHSMMLLRYNNKQQHNRKTKRRTKEEYSSILLLCMAAQQNVICYLAKHLSHELETHAMPFPDWMSQWPSGNIFQLRAE